MSIFKKLAWFFKANKKLYILGILALILTDFFDTLLPSLIGKAADSIIAKQFQSSKLLTFLVLIAGTVIAMNIARWFWQFFILQGTAKLERTLRTQLYDHYMIMDAPFYQQHRTGELMTLATNDVSQVQRVAGGGILMLFDSVAIIVFTIIQMMFNSGWKLTLIAVVPLPILAFGVSRLFPMIRQAFLKRQEAYDELSNKTQESIKGIKAIKALGQAGQDIEEFEGLIGNSIKANNRISFIDSLFEPLVQIVTTISFVAMVILGGRAVIKGQMSIGQLIAFWTYLNYLIWPMFAIGQVFNVLERGNASYERIQAVLKEESHVDPSGNDERAQGDLDLSIDTFTYPDNTTGGTDLHNVHSHLSAGHTLGIVGPVGSGKTTLIKLLMRQFEDFEGHINLGAYDIRDYKLENYRHALGYVPQENFLFSDTIAANIAFACPDASQEAIEQAAIKADLHKDILGMPDGYETQIGEQGISLSGGQRQRLAIARAILVNPELLILDDALSAVDAKTEQAILATLAGERAGKTTIILAHRMSSVAQSSEILVMKDGTIAERGNHDDLMAQGGWYHDIYNQQKGGDTNGQ
jgi:ATP-binding cassette subfamily B protein/ATP-binding cassette subfamily C protein